MDHQHQWLPPLPSPSHAPIQTLQDQFSRISLGSDVVSGLPRPNLNVDHHQQTSLSPWELEGFRTFLAAKRHEEIASSSYPNLINIPLGLGSGSGSNSGSSFSYGDYSSLLPRNGFRPRAIDDDNEHLRRFHELYYTNNNNNIINNMNIYHDYNHDSALTSLLYNSKHYHLNYNTRSTPRTTRNNRVVYNNSGAINPRSVVFYPSTWEEIKGKVVYFVNDKSLSQFLIKKFEMGQMEGIKMVVSEIKGSVTVVLLNQVGSQFFQRLLDFLDHHDILELIKAVMANQQEFLLICLDNQGTRAAQKLIKFMDRNSREEKALLLNAIRGVTVTLTKNMNGYHLIEELLKTFRGVYEVIGPLLGEIADHCLDIAMDKSGCCVIQYCIQHGHQGPERDRIIHEIITHALELAENDYGNYVVQFIVGMKSDPHITAQVIRGLEGNFVYLSKNKFGSHVVEKCLKEAGDDQVNRIITEIIEDPNSFLDILQHPMGNFVAQTALQRSKEMQVCNIPSMYPILVERINNNYAFLHSHMHGKRVLSHVKCHKFRGLR